MSTMQASENFSDTVEIPDYRSEEFQQRVSDYHLAIKTVEAEMRATPEYSALDIARDNHRTASYRQSLDPHEIRVTKLAYAEADTAYFSLKWKKLDVVYARFPDVKAYFEVPSREVTPQISLF